MKFSSASIDVDATAEVPAGIGQLRAVRNAVDSRLEALVGSLPGVPESLQGAVRHALLGESKRVRPVLLFLVAEPEPEQEQAALDLGSADEMVQTATLILDALKGAVAVWVALRWGLNAGLAAGLGAFLGHLFPAWLSFKGGKGVATYIGVLLALAWQGLVAFAVVWLAIAFLTRYSSLAALVASVTTPIFLYLYGATSVAGLIAVLTLLIIWKHRPNIERLLAGTENKIGAK